MKEPTRSTPTARTAPLATLCLSACLLLAPSLGLAQYNVSPHADNPYNTRINRATESGGFRCSVYVKSIWTASGGSLYAAFTNDSTWYQVTESHMQPLLYAAHALGKKVCYQTKGGAMENIAINVVFFDPN